MFSDKVTTRNSLQSIELKSRILVVSNTPLEASPQVHLHHSFPLPSVQEPLLTSSSSFEDSYTSNNRTHEGHYWPGHIISTISESNESTGKNSSIYQSDSTRF